MQRTTTPTSGSSMSSAVAALAALLLSSRLTASPVLAQQAAEAAEGEDHIPAPVPESPSDSAPGCPSWTFTDSPLGAPLEHSDGVCDRLYENDPDRIEGLRLELQRSVETGQLRQLRDEVTWVCPSDDAAASMGAEEEEGEGGYGTPLTGPASVWLFRNEASTPVSVGWINPYADNAEVSAFHPQISPPHADPRSILRPGEWRSLDVFMGHTFQIRELLVSQGGGDLVPGRVLVRHRPGPIPIRNRYGGPKACPVRALVDPDPQQEEPNPRARDAEDERRRVEEGRKKFRRTDFHYNHRCNALHRVFTNRVGCPVDVYYGGVSAEGHVASREGTGARSHSPPPPPNSNGTDADADAAAVPSSPNLSNSCFERFKFHLGINPSHASDYVDKWDSPVAFEATYLTHKFVARLRHDPSVVVDEVIIDRTVVRDCPEGDAKGKGSALAGELVGAGVGRAEVDLSGEGGAVGEKFDAVGEAAAKAMGLNVTAPGDFGASPVAFNSSSPASSASNATTDRAARPSGEADGAVRASTPKDS